MIYNTRLIKNIHIENGEEIHEDTITFHENMMLISNLQETIGFFDNNGKITPYYGFYRVNPTTSKNNWYKKTIITISDNDNIVISKIFKDIEKVDKVLSDYLNDKKFVTDNEIIELLTKIK